MAKKTSIPGSWRALLFLAALTLNTNVFSQENSVSIGTAELKDNAVLWLNGNGSQGFLLPATNELTNITTPDAGMVVYHSQENKIYWFNGSSWLAVGDGGTSGGGNYSLGFDENNGNDLVLKLEGVEVDRVSIAQGTQNTNQVLTWNGQEWVASTIIVNNLQGFAIPDQATLNAEDEEKVLVFNGTLNPGKWELRPLSSGGGAVNLDELNDVNASSPQNNQVLRYNSTNQQWEPATINTFSGDFNDLSNKPEATDVPYTDNNSLGAANVQEAIDALASSGVIDTDDQTLNLTGTELTISEGNTVDLASIDTNTDAQQLSLSGTQLTIENGNSVDLASIDTNTDDQTASEVPFDGAASNITATDVQGAIEELKASGVVDTDDQTADEVAVTPSGNLASTNVQSALTELQADIDNVVDTDDQTLSLSGTELTISEGNTIDLATIDTDTDTDDQIAAEVVFDGTASSMTATDVQGAIEELKASGVIDTDDQILSYDGTTQTLSLTDGGSVTLNIADADATNEIQDLSVTDNTTSVDITPTGGGAITLAEGTNIDLTTSGNVVTINATGFGSGDMLQSTYDADGNGVVDDAESAQALSGTITSSQVSDLNTTIDTRIGTTSVTALSDVTNAGSGQIITDAERTLLNNQSGINTGDEVDFIGPGASGLVPDPGSSTGRVLQDDGTWVTLSGGGDMIQSTYDADGNGVVDDAESAQALSGTITSSQVSDLNTTIDTRIGITSVTVLSDVTNAGSGQIITDAERTLLNNQSGINTGDEVDFMGPGGSGLVPDPGSSTGRVLQDDGTWVTLSGGGDMLQSTYDADGNGVVDDAESAQALSGTITSSQVSDLNTTIDTRIGTTSVTALSDVTNAGSGQIITDAERTLLNNQSGINTGDEVDFMGPGGSGLVPDPGSSTGRVLQDDGTWVTLSGGGDMLQSTYDADGNGVVDDAESAQALSGTITSSQVSDFSTAVNTNATVAGALQSTNNLSDVSNTTTARTNLGLGTLATVNTVNSSLITDGTISNVDIASTAAIDISKISGLIDNDATNELITGFAVNGANLELTDAGATYQVPLTSLQDGIGATDLSGLSDANITTPTDAQIIIYDGVTDNQFENVSISGDINITNTGVATISPDAIGSSELEDGSVANVDIAAGIDVAKLELASGNGILTSNGTTNAWLTTGSANKVLGTNLSGNISFRDATIAIVDGGYGIQDISLASDAVIATEKAVREAIDAAEGATDLQGAYDGGHTIQLDGTNEFTINNASGNPVLITNNDFQSVGIGRAPGQKLDIEGNSATGVVARVQNTNPAGWASFNLVNDTGVGGYSLAIGGTTATNAPNKFYIFNNGAPRFVLDQNGNVGLGTENPVSQLQLSSRTHFFEESGATFFSNNLYVEGTPKYTTAGAASILGMENGSLSFYNAPAGSAGSDATITPVFQISPEGNFGFGQTGGPGVFLEAIKPSESGVSEQLLYLGITDNLNGRFIIGNGTATDGEFSPRITTYSTGGSPLTFENILDMDNGYSAFLITSNIAGGTSIPDFTSLLTLENNGSTKFSVGGAGTITAFPSVNSALVVNPYSTGPGGTSEIQFKELTANGYNHVSFKAPDNLSNDITLTLPISDGDPNQILTTDGNGFLSWSSPLGVTASNGLTIASSEISLGGTLTKNTFIETEGYKLMVSDDINPAIFELQGPSTTTLGLYNNSGVNYGYQLQVNNDQLNIMASLDNFSTTSLPLVNFNVSALEPFNDDTYALGSPTMGWSSVYTNDLFAAGNIGIGTLTPQNKLQIGNTLGLNNVSGMDVITHNIYVDGTDGRLVNNGGGSSLFLGSDRISLFTYPLGNQDELVTDPTNSFNMTSTGIVINGDSKSPSAVLQINADDRGILLPRVTTVQRDLISAPATGLLIYNSTDISFDFYNGSAWQKIGADNLGNHTASQTLQMGTNTLEFSSSGSIFGSGANLTAQSGANIHLRPNANYDVTINDDNFEYARFEGTSRSLGIGISAPEASLHIQKSGGQQFKIGNTNQTGLEWSFNVNGSSNFILQNEGGGSFVDALTIEPNNGNIGIGITSNLSKKLAVYAGSGTTNLFGGEIINEYSGNSPSFGLFVGNYSSSGNSNRIGIQSSVLGGSTSEVTGFYSEVEHEGSGTTYLYKGDNAMASSGMDYGIYLSGSIESNFLGGNTGLGVSLPINRLDVGGGAAIGTTYAGAYNAPTNGLLVQGNVGIGVTSPSEKLEVVGNIEIPAANEYKYSSAKTQVISVSSSAFTPVDGNTGNNLYIGGYTSGNARWVLGSNTGASAYLLAPVNLPDGAAIIQFDLAVHDDDVSYDVSGELMRHTFGGTVSSVIAQAPGTSGTPGTTIITDNTISHTVNNNAYSYFIRVLLKENISLLRIYGAKITYTVTQVD